MASSSGSDMRERRSAQPHARTGRSLGVRSLWEVIGGPQAHETTRTTSTTRQARQDRYNKTSTSKTHGTRHAQHAQHPSRAPPPNAAGVSSPTHNLHRNWSRIASLASHRNFRHNHSQTNSQSAQTAHRNPVRFLTRGHKCTLAGLKTHPSMASAAADRVRRRLRP